VAMLWLVAQRGATAPGVSNFLGHAERFLKVPPRPATRRSHIS
jgi:hypothetical protein